MTRTTHWHLWLIDALGALALTACLGGVVWLTGLRHNSARQENAALRAQLQADRQTLATMKLAVERQQSKLNAGLRQLEISGRLPQESPIEEYFQSLAVTAARSGLHVLSQTPAETRIYPGLTEKCFSYEITGTIQSILSFLQSVEHTPYWADVSYLKIDQGDAAGTGPDVRRSAALTLSLFAAVDDREARQ